MLRSAFASLRALVTPPWSSPRWISLACHGIVPPVPSPLLPDESIDVEALARLVEFQLKAGVHGLWILGTTARFDLLTDARLRDAAEVAASAAAGRVPLVPERQRTGTRRTEARASRFDDLPYDYYARACRPGTRS